MRGHKLLNILIFAGLLAGVVVGFLLLKWFDSQGLTGAEIGQKIAWLATAGDLILIRPLKMLIIPLVFASVVVGITSIGDPSRLGLVGTTTILYYFATMFVAVVLGAFLVTSIRPGDGVSQKVDFDQVRLAFQDLSLLRMVEPLPIASRGLVRWTEHLDDGDDLVIPLH